MQGGNAGGRATRELLLRTAEQLFADRGIAAVSLREIGLHAGQRNSGVLQYHFGSRENLVASIYEDRAKSLNERRLVLIDELERAGADSRMDQLLMALLQPHVESLSEPGNHFVQFLARVLTDEASLEILTQESAINVLASMTGYDRLRAKLHACVPSLSAAEFQRRFTLIFDWAIHALAQWDRSHPDDEGMDETELSDLLAMLTAALSTQPPRAQVASARSRSMTKRKAS